VNQAAVIKLIDSVLAALELQALRLA